VHAVLDRHGLVTRRTRRRHRTTGTVLNAIRPRFEPHLEDLFSSRKNAMTSSAGVEATAQQSRPRIGTQTRPRQQRPIQFWEYGASIDYTLSDRFPPE
jgi:hypothetical protein